MQVVERGLGLNPHVARLGRLDFGMFAASVVERDDLAVVRAPLVRADAEHFAQIALQRDEEPAGGAQIARRGLGGQRLASREASYQRCAVWARLRARTAHGDGTDRMRSPRHRHPPQLWWAERPETPQVHCRAPQNPMLRYPMPHPRHRPCPDPFRFHVPCIRNARVTGLGFGGRPETFLQPRIIRVGADGVGHRQVGRQQTVLPWNPFRRAQRPVPWE